MFGKKKATLADPASQPLMSDNVTQFMEKLGLSPEEIADMANPVSGLQREIDQSEAALRTFVIETNEAWSQRMNTTIDLQPYRMIPTTVWDSFGPSDQTLLMDILGVLPAQPWNILLLAMNDETARLLDVGRYPSTLSEEERTAAGIVKISITEELERLGGDRIDGHTNAGHTNAGPASAARIVAMARPVAASSLGREVVDRSRAVFFDD